MIPVTIPLDDMSRDTALNLARRLSGSVWGFKVNDLLLSCGVEIIRELKAYGKVFADPKLHDIPNTVANSVKALVAAGADLITVHASGGRGMLQAAVSNAGSARILAVTALTSLADSDTNEVYGNSPAETVKKFAAIAANTQTHGIVCSPQELELLSKDELYAKLLKVIPGIRPAWHGKADDQVRIMTPALAFEKGASLLVIGRPITGHADPSEAVRLIAEELKNIKSNGPLI